MTLRDLLQRWRSDAATCERLHDSRGALLLRTCADDVQAVMGEGQGATVTSDITSAAIDYTAAELGKALHLAPSTIRTICAAGELPGAYRRNGREWRIPQSAISAMQKAAQDAAHKRESAAQSSDSSDLGAWRQHARGS